MRYIKEEVNQILTQLRIGQRITVGYYVSRSREYLTCSGRVTQINNNRKHLSLGEVTFDYRDIDLISVH